jgi:hypothetical protein
MTILTFHYVRCSYISLHILNCIIFLDVEYIFLQDLTFSSIHREILINGRKLYSIFLMLGRVELLCNISRNTEFNKAVLLTELVGSRSGTRESYCQTFCVSLPARMSPSLQRFFRQHYVQTGSWACPASYRACTEGSWCRD